MLPIGLVGLLLSRKWLYRLFVFWTLFSASSAANFGQGENVSAVQLWMVFGSLWLVRLTLDHLMVASFAVDRRILRPCLWLVGFLFVASLSVAMPVFIDGTLSITSPILFDGSETPLFFTSHNVTQLLYLVLGCTIAISVAHSNLEDRDRQETERVIVISAACLCAWGLVQFFCNLTGIPYPDYIFNNSGSVSAKGYLETLNGVGRISSAAVEPSIFALSLITVLPLTLPGLLRRGWLFSVPVDRFCAAVFILLLILSTSSTAYLGLLLLAMLLVPVFARTRTMSFGRALKFTIAAATTLAAAVILAGLLVPAFRNVITSALLEKAISGSSLERAMTIRLAFGYFQQYPLLGIGWGSATSHDLIIKLLSNVGILGTYAFVGAMCCVIRRNWRALGPLSFPVSLSRTVWFLGFSVFLVTSIAIGFPLALGNFWLFLGMSISTAWEQP